MFHVERTRPIEILARGLVRCGETVLVCRSLKHGHCYLPGGHVEFGESTVDALRREFREETGRDVRVGKLVTVIEQRFIQRNKERHELSLVFHVELEEFVDGCHPPEIRSQEADIAFEWHRAAELESSEFVPAPLAKALLREQVPAWLTLDSRLGE